MCYQSNTVSCMTSIVIQEGANRPINALLAEGVKFAFTPAMEKLVREILCGAHGPAGPRLLRLGRRRRRLTPVFHVYCDACIDG